MVPGREWRFCALVGLSSERERQVAVRAGVSRRKWQVRAAWFVGVSAAFSGVTSGSAARVAVPERGWQVVHVGGTRAESGDFAAPVGDSAVVANPQSEWGGTGTGEPALG